MAGMPEIDATASGAHRAADLSNTAVEIEVTRYCNRYHARFRKEADMACNQILSMWKKLWAREAILEKLELDKAHGIAPKGVYVQKQPPVVPAGIKDDVDIVFAQVKTVYISVFTDHLIELRKKELVQWTQAIAMASTEHLAHIDTFIRNAQETSRGQMSEGVALGVKNHYTKFFSLLRDEKCAEAKKTRWAAEIKRREEETKKLRAEAQEMVECEMVAPEVRELQAEVKALKAAQIANLAKGHPQSKASEGRKGPKNPSVKPPKAPGGGGASGSRPSGKQGQTPKPKPTQTQKQKQAKKQPEQKRGKNEGGKAARAPARRG